jgi:hypothetical protein
MVACLGITSVAMAQAPRILIGQPTVKLPANAPQVPGLTPDTIADQFEGRLIANGCRETASRRDIGAMIKLETLKDATGAGNQNQGLADAAADGAFGATQQISITVGAIGSKYQVGASALNVANGSVVGRAQATADSVDGILDAIDAVAADIAKLLGCVTEVQMTFNAEEKIVGGIVPGGGTLSLQLVTSRRAVPALVGSGTTWKGSASIWVSGTLAVASAICTDTHPVTGRVEVNWAVTGGVSQPLSWSLIDRDGWPRICIAPLAGATLGPEDYMPMLLGEAFDPDPAVPLQGAHPDARAVSSGAPFTVHYTGTQTMHGEDSLSVGDDRKVFPVTGTRTYDLTVAVTPLR